MSHFMVYTPALGIDHPNKCEAIELMEAGTKYWKRKTGERSKWILTSRRPCDNILYSLKRSTE